MAHRVMLSVLKATQRNLPYYCYIVNLAAMRRSSSSGSDRERGGQLFECGDDGECGQPPGARIFGRGHVLDLHRKAGGVGFDLDTVSIARQPRVGPDLDRRAIGADPGEC